MDREEWRMIPDYEGLYMVSNKGRVKNCRTGRILKPGKQTDGYLMVVLCKNGKCTPQRVHRLVAMAFIPNPNNLPCVNHKDEDKTNNCVDNLEWCTVSYNNRYGTRLERCIDATRNNTLSKGVAQYTLDMVMVAVYPSRREAARQTGFSSGNISRNCNGYKESVNGYIFKDII